MEAQALSSVPALPGGLRRELAEGQTLPEVAELHAGGGTTKRHWVRRGVLFAAVITIGVLQYLTPPTTLHWLYVLQRLYYVAIALAGLDMGWHGGLTAALLSGAAFATGTPSIWTVSRVDILDQCLEICVFCLVGVLTGILTDRQRKQAHALRNATDELRQAHQELRQNFESMKRAERLHALGQLSAGLAHEIRTPLASIEGAAAVVQRMSHGEEKCHELLEIIQKESRRLNRLLTSFLDFAKPRRPDMKMVEIDDLFNSVIALARHAGNNRLLELRKDRPPGLSTLECDPEQLKQVLLNLIMNAIQAMPQGGTVVLAARQIGHTVTIDVQDQGCGISHDNLERIFDPFFTTKDTGSGLGLSVADQIIRQHGGMLTIARSSPEGATVRISLPLKSSHT
jgi:two-component system, NtrC family, sensor histidine kinase HydH